MIQLSQGSEPGISRRIELITRFNVTGEKYASENFKIMNYGLGGTIQKHWDSIGNFSSKFNLQTHLQTKLSVRRDAAGRHRSSNSKIPAGHG